MFDTIKKFNIKNDKFFISNIITFIFVVKYDFKNNSFIICSF